MFEWRSQLDTGIPAIDAQHRELVGLLADLFSAMQDGAGQKVIDQTLEKLWHYATTHFAMEEGLMDESGYPAKEAHLTEHAIFTRRIGDLAGHAGTRVALSIQVILFLRNWLTNHIGTVDQELGDFLRVRSEA